MRVYWHVFCKYFIYYLCPMMAFDENRYMSRYNVRYNIKKLKWSLYRPSVAQRMGRGTALLFHNRGIRRGWVVSSTPRPHFTPRKDLVPILQEAGWAPGPVWTGGKSRPHWESIQDSRVLLNIIVIECTTPSSAIWRCPFWCKFAETFVETDESRKFFLWKVSRFIRDITASYPRRR